MAPPPCLKERWNRQQLEDYDLNPDDQGLQRVIQDPEAVDTLVNMSRQIGHFVVKGLKKDDQLTTRQLRAIFGEVKRIQMKFDPRRLRLLKPKLRYMAARHGLGAKALRTVLEKCLDEVGDDEERFSRFVEFFEAILAYHKDAGGQD
jgi:CRISPR-associated protein Csm2